MRPYPSSTMEASVPEDWPAHWASLLLARADPTCIPAAPEATAKSAATRATSAALLPLYRPLIDARRALAHDPDAPPWWIGQLGQSLDGCVATAAGDSYYVTGPASLLHLHCLRALCDAVLVGAGTVAADNPRLTTRHVEGPQPVRVVLDPAARLDGRANLLGDAQAPTLWLCDTRRADAARALLPKSPGVAEVVAIDGLWLDDDPARGCDPARAVAALSARGLRIVLVEGGGVTVSRFLAARALDRLHLCIAPVLIGAGRRGLTGPARHAMAECPRPPVRTVALGDDMLWDLDLRGAGSGGPSTAASR